MRSPKIGLFGAASLWALSAGAAAQGLVTIPAKNLGSALDDYIRQSGVQLIYRADDVADLTSNKVHDAAPEAALAQILAGTGLTASRDASGAVVIVHADAGDHQQNLDRKSVV